MIIRTLLAAMTAAFALLVMGATSTSASDYGQEGRTPVKGKSVSQPQVTTHTYCPTPGTATGCTTEWRKGSALVQVTVIECSNGTAMIEYSGRGLNPGGWFTAYGLQGAADQIEPDGTFTVGTVTRDWLDVGITGRAFAGSDWSGRFNLPHPCT